MHSASKLTLVAAAVCLLGTTIAAPAIDQSLGSILYQGPRLNYYYQGPDGTYASQSDFLGDLNGTPCDMNCTRAAQERWSKNYGHPDGQ